MKLRLLLPLALLMMLFSGTGRTRVDEKAEVLLKEVNAATAAAHTLSADFTIVWRFRGERRTEGTVKLMKPNFARIEFSEPGALSTFSDGNTVWEISRELNQASYRKRMASPQGSNIEWLPMLPVNAFFDASFFSRDEFGGATPTFAGRETVDGVPYSVIQAVVDKPATMTIKLYIGADSLVHRVTTEAPVDDEFFKTEAVFKNIKTGAVMPATDFAFELPAGANLLPPAAFSNGNPELLPRGSMAPDFTLPTPTGGQISLASALRGKKAVLINFWFDGCIPCRDEFPRLQKLYNELKDKGVEIVAVNTIDSAETINKYLKESKLSFKIGMTGPRGSKDFGFHKQYGVTGYPTNYLLGSEGKIVFRATGFNSDYGLRGALEKMGVR